MAIAGIDHWVIICKDVNESAAFYQKLGLDVTWQEKRGGGSRPIIRVGDTQLIKFYAADRYEIESPLGAPNYGTGTMDFCLYWDGTPEELQDSLEKAAIPIRSGPSPRSGGRGRSTSIYVRDPDDNLVEITSYSGE